MGSSSKKKKEKKQQDFQKTKLKVGKTKQQPTNRTNTSFSTKKIILAEQSIITHQNDRGEFTTSRNLGLKELTSHLKHYAPQTRKDAITGIQELFTNHPLYIIYHLSTFLPSLLKLTLDDSESVRTQLSDFLELFIPTIQSQQDAHQNAEKSTADVLRPFHGQIVAYLSAALTHLNEDVRADAVRLVQSWCEWCPSMMRAFKNNLMPAFLSLLTTSKAPSSKLSSAIIVSASVQASSKAKKKSDRPDVLGALYTFLGLVGSDDSVRPKDATSTTRQDQLNLAPHALHYPTHLNHLLTPETETRQFNLFANDITPSEQSSELLSPSTTETTDRYKLTALPTSGTTTSTQQKDTHENALLVLMQPLTDLFLDAMPLIMTPTSSSQIPPALDTCSHVIQILSLLITSFPSHDALTTVWTKLRRHFLVHFPFRTSSMSFRDSTRIQDRLTDLNIEFCGVLARILAYGDLEGGQSVVIRVSQFIQSLFSANQESMLHNLKPEQLKQLLVVAKRMLGVLETDHTNQLLRDVQQFAQQWPATNVLRAIATEWLCRLTQERTESISTQMQAFVASLPSLLCDLRGTNAELSHTILSTLHCTFRISQSSSATFDITPFYCTTALELKFGPFVHLPHETQILAIQILYYLPSIPLNLLSGVTTCIIYLNSSRLSSVWCDVMAARVLNGKSGIEDALNVAITLGCGWTRQEFELWQTELHSSEDASKCDMKLTLQRRRKSLNSKAVEEDISDSNALEYIRDRLQISHEAVTLVTHLLSTTFSTTEALEILSEAAKWNPRDLVPNDVQLSRLAMIMEVSKLLGLDSHDGSVKGLIDQWVSIWTCVKSVLEHHVYLLDVLSELIQDLCSIAPDMSKEILASAQTEEFTSSNDLVTSIRNRVNFFKLTYMTARAKETNVISRELAPLLQSVLMRYSSLISNMPDGIPVLREIDTLLNGLRIEWPTIGKN